MTHAGVLRLPLPDGAARVRIVTDLEGNLLVEAGAGSGKTTELVARMVALLETGTARVDELAAVTFTRKAAGELRGRFQNGIEGRLSATAHSGEADEVARERLSQALDEIDRAFIGTIHAFCARLLRERPLEVGLDPGFQEMEAEERLTIRRRFWQSYLERLARESDPILEDLARAGLRPASLYRFFEKVVENPDVEFPADPSPPASADELAAVRQVLDEIVSRAWELMPEREPERGWDSLQKKLRTLHFSRDVTEWNAPAHLYEAIGLLCKPGPTPHGVTQNRWRHTAQAVALRDEVNRFGLGDAPGRRLYLRWLAHRYALAVRLAQHAAGEFAAHRRRIGKLDFPDLLALAADLLRVNPDVRRDLGARYRRLLVDEFQDTDPQQAEIMLLIASEPEDSTGSPEASTEGRTPEWMSAAPRPGALFVVGDPKQSIYRFRRADIQLYGLVKRRFREFGGVLELTSNFRSRPPIGDLVNEHFRTDGFFPAEATLEQAAFEPLNTRPPDATVGTEGVFIYDVEPGEANAVSAARDDAARLASWLRRRIAGGERTPGDFLILTFTKSRIAAYARALETYGIPVDVTGAGVGAEEEIRELQVVLECLIDPGNPVCTLAALVGLCFGLDYERLVEHRLQGGGFDVMHPGERGHPDVLDALRMLYRWWRASSREAADVFVPGLVSELGLLPLAAARELGAERAGAIVFALDAVRAAALAGDASLPGALTAMQSALDLAEAEAPLQPARPNVVRLMNLHQAKGLEGTVVILADPGRRPKHAPDLHVVRTPEGGALGYARVQEAAEGWSSGRDLAMPAIWDEMAEVEDRFERAEDVRLLYVAVTRAREELVVVRWPATEKDSFWSPLHTWLDRRATRLDLAVEAPPPRAEIPPDAATLVDARVAESVRMRAAASTPSYTHVTVTGLAKPAGASDRFRASGEARGEIDAEDLRGFSWGSAVHGALAAAARALGVEPLRATCRDLLVEHGRPLDDHGEPVELDELTELVRAVQASELWMRALRAEHLLAEVPFAVPHRRVSLLPEPEEEIGRPLARPQLDLFGGATKPHEERPAPSGEAARGPDAVLEGVIDLAFLERGGWVIADYKTDVGTDPDFQARRAAYRRQVDLYAEAWATLTGDPIKERVLVFTAQGREERW